MKRLTMILLCLVILACGCSAGDVQTSQTFSEQGNLQGDSGESTLDNQSESEVSVSDNQSEAATDNSSADDTESYTF